MSRKMKDSGVEWIGYIPDSWNTTRLGWCVNEVKEKNNPIKTTNVLSLTNKLGVVPYEEKGNQGNKAKEDYSQYGLAFENTLVVNSMNVLIGSVGISNYYGCVSPVYYVYRANDNSDLRYINYLFQNVGFQKEMRKYANGILEIRMRISSHDMLRRIIPVPSLDEQKKISDYLDDKCGEIDNIVSKTQVSIEEYKKLKQSIITEAVTKGVRGDREMKKGKNMLVGEIPIDWSERRMKELSIVISDGIHSSPNYDEEGEYFFINGNNIGGEYIEIKNTTNRLNAAERKKYPIEMLNDNSILISLNGATYGKVSLYKENPVLLGKSAGYITLNGSVTRKFIRYYLMSEKSKAIMALSLNGTTIQNLSLSTLKGFYICYPEKREQFEIVEYLDNKCNEIDLLIMKKEKMIDYFDLYKKSLIYEYVTGKKEVS